MNPTFSEITLFRMITIEFTFVTIPIPPPVLPRLFEIVLPIISAPVGLSRKMPALETRRGNPSTILFSHLFFLSAASRRISPIPPPPSRGGRCFP